MWAALAKEPSVSTRLWGKSRDISDFYFKFFFLQKLCIFNLIVYERWKAQINKYLETGIF
jgi:hypothetical protein